jgi:hypothetical protein
MEFNNPLFLILAITVCLISITMWRNSNGVYSIGNVPPMTNTNNGNSKNKNVSENQLPQLPNPFTLKGNRYKPGVNEPQNVATPHSNIPFTSQPICQLMAENNPINWTTRYEPGANNTYEDLHWHGNEPRTMLKDNSMRCDEFRTNSRLNPPVAIAGTPGQVGTFGNEFDSPDFTSLIWDELTIPKYSVDYKQPHTMSPNMGLEGKNTSTGIVPSIPDCVNKRVQETYRC